MARILNSPNQNVASEQLVLLQDTLTQIKQMIIRGLSPNEIKKAIQIFTNKFADNATRQALERSLTQSANKMMYQYNYNMNITNQAFIQKVVKTYKIGSGLTQSSKSYTIDLDAIYSEYLNGNISQRKVIEEFRGYITNGKYGLALIKNYDKQVIEQTKLLASEPGKYTDKNGRSISLRNKVEMSVRYAANQNDLAQYKNEGVKLVWTSSHADASPRCSPFQGKLWSLDGKSGVINGIRYRPIDEALNANGGNSIINGYNCRHYLIEYEEGSKAPKHYTSAEIQKEYKIDQKQRNYENNIRLLKTEETLLRQQGFTKEASAYRKKWQALNKKYEQFSVNNNRAFYPWRTRISQEEKEKPSNYILKEVNEIIDSKNKNIFKKQIEENIDNIVKPIGGTFRQEEYEFRKNNNLSISTRNDNENNIKLRAQFYQKYQDGIANENNFFIDTIGFFDKIMYKPDKKPSYISYNRDGEISSEYWYTSEGVIRGSNHWGLGIASCDWLFKDEIYNGIMVKDDIEYGFIKWENFIQKSSEIIIDKKIYLSSFRTTLGKDEYRSNIDLVNGKIVINGKIYDIKQYNNSVNKK